MDYLDRLTVRDLTLEDPLTPAEERRVAKVLKEGRTTEKSDEKVVYTESARAARDTLIRKNGRLVVDLAGKKWRFINQSIPFDDLCQEGVIGLMRAIDKFDVDLGFKFSTYATWWIKQAMHRCLPAQQTIRVPTHMYDFIGTVKRARRALAEDLGQQPTQKQIASLLGVPEAKVKLAENQKCVTSLDQPVGDTDDGATVGNFVELPFDVDEPRAQGALVELINQFLHLVTAREARILTLYHGLGDSETHTLDETAKKFNLTRERIRQIRNEAYAKIIVMTAFNDEELSPEQYNQAFRDYGLGPETLDEIRLKVADKISEASDIVHGLAHQVEEQLYL